MRSAREGTNTERPSLKVNRVTLQAVSRLSPKMLAYHLKRAARNAIARRLPEAYARRIERTASTIPGLQLSPSLELPKRVSRFYKDEYVDDLDNAALGTFSFFGKSVRFGSTALVDWHHTIAEEADLHLWRMKLAHMGFVGPMLMSDEVAHLTAATEMIACFSERASFATPGCFTSYWFPYSASHRVLGILSGYLIALSERSVPEEACQRIEDFLRWNVGFIIENIEHELKNNHVERNLAALCLYFSHAVSVPAALKTRLDREVHDIVDACVLGDGLLSERSAMYQGLTVMALDIFAHTPFLSERTLNLVRHRLARAERAWFVMTHPDGQISLFNDAWFGEVPPVARILPAQALQPLEVLPIAGYARLHRGSMFALLDAGPIGPRWNPGHGHADFLALEADVDQMRFIVDPGTYQYSTGPRRTFDRSAASHNGPAREGVEPVEYSGCFKVGRMASAHLVEASMYGDRVMATARLNQGRLSTQRRVSLCSKAIDIQDEWMELAEAGSVRLLVPRLWSITEQSATRLLFEQKGIQVLISIEYGTLLRVDTAHWSSRYLQSEQAWEVVLAPGRTDHNGARLDWSIRKIGPGAAQWNTKQ